MKPRYSIAEWYGRPFAGLSVADRQRLARCALKHEPAPPCPFRRDLPRCNKSGGVCSIRAGKSAPVITCPERFAEGNLLPAWLARIVGFPEIYMASEVPFMRNPANGLAAGKIDLVIARDGQASAWFGLEIQAVYFSGDGMAADFDLLMKNEDIKPPEPVGKRRPDFRSSGAKRLMPQLQVKGPTLRRWNTKLAVAVDLPFFEYIGGASEEPSQDLNDGDIVWLVPRVTDDCRLIEHHWEVLSLEDSSDKLLSADEIKRHEFEEALRAKLKRIGGPDD